MIRVDFLGAWFFKISGAWKPREVEAIGLKEALSWVIARGYTQCVFKMDSYALADACNKNPGRALFDTICYGLYPSNEAHKSHAS